MNENSKSQASDKVERLKQRMRDKQGFASAAGTPKPQAIRPISSPAAPAPVGPCTVKHPCGHEVPFREVPKDKFRNERYAKELKRPCPDCRQAKHLAEVEAAKTRKQQPKPRKDGVSLSVGVGYSFIFHHLGEKDWNYQLVNIKTGAVVHFGVGQKSFRLCMNAMNQILLGLEKQEASNLPAEAAVVIPVSSPNKQPGPDGTESKSPSA